MPAISVPQAQEFVQWAAVDGQVAAAGTTSTGRPTPMSFTLNAALLIVERAAQLEWVAGDEDGLHLWVLTRPPGNRWYRIAAVNPADQPDPEPEPEPAPDPEPDLEPDPT